MGAFPQRKTSQYLIAISIVAHPAGIHWLRQPHSEQLAARRKLACAMGVAKKAIVAGPEKSVMVSTQLR